MKIQELKNRLFGAGLVLLLTVVCLAPMHSRSAEPEAGKSPMMDGKMKDLCTEMKEAKEKMMAKMKEQDADLGAKVAAMNAAPADQKQALMAGLITEMVEQRAAMHEEKEKMEEKMMTHMMEHMEMGKESMSECPMMKGVRARSGHAKEGSEPAPNEAR